MAPFPRVLASLLAVLTAVPLNAASVRAQAAVPEAPVAAPAVPASVGSEPVLLAASDLGADFSETLADELDLKALYDGASGRGSAGAVRVAASEGLTAALSTDDTAPRVSARGYSVDGGVSVPAATAAVSQDAQGAKGIYDRVSDIVNRLLGRNKKPQGPDPAEVLKSRYWIVVEAKTRDERQALAEAGMSIENHGADFVEGIADKKSLEEIKKRFKVLKEKSLAEFQTQLLDFPPKDAEYHNYAEMTQKLDELAAAYPALVSKFSIGKSLQGDKDIWAIRINSSEKGTAPSKKPGVVFMGAHHAREHLSVEVPLRLAKKLLESSDPSVRKLLETRDVYIIPMVNPDGAEFDIQKGNYAMWRKNMRDNGDGSFGVDLNRNYGYKWGTGGSSKSPSSDVYMGPKPFSEPETQAIKRFVDERPNLKILLSYHTFSELILYPWGNTYDPIEDKKALAIHETMARQMAQWTGYTPQQSSDLYIASGDTTDWAYGEKGLISFTFELTPKSMWEGGFYPGTKAIASSVEKNFKPMVYLIDHADDPSRVLPGGGKPQKPATGTGTSK